ncbi:hypothetical protein RM590_08540 [Streptomyces sp. DSM 44938]|uniref:Uncharacterized protein n=1 Tax=Streptomyces litchfieldiae TaxID=3075543 RepID=A0ABU2MM34_9ACTN|nr:hypothetical protein [Streptomyces sp. DSM 44938]MDT0342671.1 hypothetical protein [Streptomyces sp. DSM 44938]
MERLGHLGAVVRRRPRSGGDLLGLTGEPFKRQAAIATLCSSDVAVTNAREGTSEIQRVLIARDVGFTETR